MKNAAKQFLKLSVRDATEVSIISDEEVETVMNRRRPLKLTFANLSKSDLICCMNKYLNRGKMYNQPVASIPPGHKQTIYVSNSDGLIKRRGGLGGVGGGMLFVIKSKV